MIFAFFATAARIDSRADAWPRLIAALLLKKIGLLPNSFPDEQCRHQMSFKFIAKISHKELDKGVNPELYGKPRSAGYGTVDPRKCGDARSCLDTSDPAHNAF